MLPGTRAQAAPSGALEWDLLPASQAASVRSDRWCDRAAALGWWRGSRGTAHPLGLAGTGLDLMSLRVCVFECVCIHACASV